MAEEFRVLRPREYHSQLVARGLRVDKRSLDDTRLVKLETGAIRTADSSSLVKLGNTSLVCGCTYQVLEIKEKNEDNEEIKIKVELPPICSSPDGVKTQHSAQLLTSTIKTILDDSNCLDKNTFIIKGTDFYWSVDVEVICLNYDGCILDAALLAILSALRTLKLSHESLNIHNHSLKMCAIPICSSFALIGEQAICDPNLEEENVALSTFSIVIDSETGLCCHLSKIGGKAINTSKLLRCINLAKKRSTEIKMILDGLNSSETKMDCT